MCAKGGNYITYNNWNELLEYNIVTFISTKFVIPMRLNNNSDIVVYTTVV